MIAGDNPETVHVRGLVILAVAALAIGPASFLIFGGGRTRPAPAAARAAIAPVEGGCVERALAYGLTNDEAQAAQYRQTLLSPFVDHPPLPRPGFYAPGLAPDQNALLHALYHGYVVVRYRPDLAAAARRDLRDAMHRASAPVVVAAAERMPFAAGGVVYGRSTMCGTLDRAGAGQLAAWVQHARPQRLRP